MPRGEPKCAQPFEYAVIRSGRRTLSLEVRRGGEVVVRAPRRCADGIVRRFVSEHTAWVTERVERQRLRAEEYPEPTEAEREALTARARAELPERVERYSAIMGLRPTGIKITSAAGRFGSCSPKNSLCFSYRLMQRPEAAIDYVVVHELAHILHKNHGAEFYALIGSVLPDYKERRKLLK